MKNLTGPIIGLHFTKQQCGHRYRTRSLSPPTLDNANQKCIESDSAKPQPVLTHDNITKLQMTTKRNTAFVDHLWEWNTTGTVTPVEKFT